MAAFEQLPAALRKLMATRSVPVSQAELARRLGLGPTTVNKYFLENWNPEAATLSRVLEALQCDVHDLADALDAVNQRGRYAPEFVTAMHQVAEGSPEPYIRNQSEALSSLTLQLLRALERIEKLERREGTTR
jgi:transcriptional regulator with XRE-family HTH domain